MKVIKPPYPADVSGTGLSIFLAGTIDMGDSEDWQAEFARRIPAALQGDLTILNPRRDDWDSSWKQSIDNPQFRAQVEWELNGLNTVSIPVFYFAGGRKSPITLMELGVVAAKYKELGQHPIVCCPPDYWRKGNVDIVCAMFGIPVVETFDALMSRVTGMLATLNALK